MVMLRIQATITPKQFGLMEEIMEELNTDNFSRAFREIIIRYENYAKIIEAYKKERSPNF